MLALALLIDGENIPAGMLSQIETHIADLGEPIVKCVFGDFGNGRLHGWVSAAHEHGLELVFQVSGGKGKNSADIALTIRAMELLQVGHVDGFCLASGDRDFIPLATKLRQHGKKVYGFGLAANTDKTLQNSFTGFCTLAACKNTGAPSPAEPRDSAQARQIKIAEILRKTGKADAEGYVHLPVLAATIRREAPHLAAEFCGKGKFLKNLRQTGNIEESGTGSATRVRWRGNGAAATA